MAEMPLESITFAEDDRQRKHVDWSKVDDLAASIQRNGLINPPVVTKDGNLVAGFMRVNAMLKLGWEYTPVTFMEDLSAERLGVIELEENVKRQNLTWQEQAQAIKELHNKRLEQNSSWTVTDTAEELSMDISHISVYIRIGEELQQGNDRIWKASSAKAARNILERKTQRQVESELEDLRETEDEASPGTSPEAVLDPQPGAEAELKPGQDSKPSAGPRPASSDLETVDFLQWIKEYSGPKFNFLHCDFPYGIGHGKSDQGRVQEWASYSDDPEIFWGLLHALRDNLDRILLPSAHIVFWFSMNYYQETKQFLEAELGFDVEPHPLIWHKTGGSGILPDPERTYRRIYETAFFCSRGDRKILSAVPNLYSCPKKKEKHVSEKPSNMLREFLRSCIDEYSSVLDPTCGSGEALVAAESLGAHTVRGLDIEPENIEIAQENLDNHRRLARLKQQQQEDRA